MAAAMAGGPWANTQAKAGDTKSVKYLVENVGALQVSFTKENWMKLTRYFPKCRRGFPVPGTYDGKYK
ncbi:MAG: hypothetical protein ABI813_03475 [Bacteroidota bacterium]